MPILSIELQCATRFGVIFDCDGVVVNSEPLGVATLELVLQQYGLPHIRSELNAYIGHSDRATYDDLVRKHGIDFSFEEFLHALDTAYTQAVAARGMAVFPGLHELLNALQQHGVPFGIGSSAQRTKLQANLQAAGLAGVFKVVVSADDVPQAKPAPDIFLAVARSLGVSPAHCVVIEDSPTGIQAARNAGMACAAVTTSFPSAALKGADVVVPGLRNLNIQLLQQLALRLPIKTD